MRYFVFRLNFFTPVHFGDTSTGGNLEKISLNYSADTLFSALCVEAAAQSRVLLEKLIQKVQAEKILFSSLFPYYQEGSGEEELYLPKPLCRVEEVADSDIKNYQEMKLAATQMKRMKKTTWVRASQIRPMLKAMRENAPYNIDLPEFAFKATGEKVNCRLEESLPYFVGSYFFAPQAGLYFVARLEEESDLSWLKELVKSLGYTGIGGKRSSGYGKYELYDESAISNGPISVDEQALQVMLGAKDAALQMCIAPLMPLKEELKLVKEGSYKLLRRSGFIDSTNLKETVKRRDVYMLSEGSCFSRRLKGQIVELSSTKVEHSVYRSGKGLFVGLNYE